MLVDKVGNITKTMNTTQTDTTHEFDLFAKSIAGQLKAMPLRMALQAQQHIQNYLCQLRIQELQRNSQASTVTLQYAPSPSTTYYASSPNEEFEDYSQFSPSPTPPWLSPTSQSQCATTDANSCSPVTLIESVSSVAAEAHNEGVNDILQKALLSIVQDN